ncbi:hypothetical protein GCM10007879_22010 [Maritalea porphyrae]|uniref:Uncharacterized protein n=1 Tax=Maritalea porphyrae TaxID=880732 RepID=A0ABQ5US14_9HYPH|nr:hypothetical protein GCM10007879_22010 [Maritalea porphyrae]
MLRTQFGPKDTIALYNFSDEIASKMVSAGWITPIDFKCINNRASKLSVLNVR